MSFCWYPDKIRSARQDCNISSWSHKACLISIIDCFPSQMLNAYQFRMLGSDVITATAGLSISQHYQGKEAPLGKDTVERRTQRV